LSENSKKIAVSKFNGVAGTLLLLLFYSGARNPAVAIKWTFIALIPLNILDLVRTYEQRKRRSIDLESYIETLNKRIEELEAQQKLKETEKEVLETKKEVEYLELFKSINPDLPRFFKVLERHGVMLRKDLEYRLMQTKRAVYFVFEWGEGPPYPKIPRTFFSQYVDELKKQGYKIFRINRRLLKATMVIFMFIPDERVKNVEDFLYKGYWEYLNRQIEKYKDDPEVLQWFIKLKNKGGPIILITHPFALSTLRIVNLIGKWLVPEAREELKNELSQVLKEEIRAFEIKLSYLLEAVEFNERIINSFEKIETEVVNLLMTTYNLDPDNDTLFYELLTKEDFLNAFLQSIQKIDSELYMDFITDGRFFRLVKLVLDLQTHVFGTISPENLRALLRKYQHNHQNLKSLLRQNSLR